MRDILVMTIVLAGALVALRRPWMGVMLWTWVSIMNPHRYTFGFAYSAPVAAIAAGSVLLGLVFTQERESPFKGPAVGVLALFVIWITLSWQFGLDPAGDYEQWNKVMKVYLMVFAGLALLRSKQHIFALAWVAAGSLALLGIKGGLFTITSGGTDRVWGPPGSFIEDNNEFALALVITIPLLRFLQMQLRPGWGRHLMTVVMLLCAASTFGSYSRGSFLAIVAMTLLLWWRGRNRVVTGLVLVVASGLLFTFMPEAWHQRIDTIGTYEEDASAMGRIHAWINAWNLAFHYPLGVGFDAAREELFAIYSPGAPARAAHSIYFQALGNHGFIGLALFVLIWVLTWNSARWLRTQARHIPQARWAAELGAMCQVSLIGYLVGGAFLSLTYFDLPYNIMMLVVLARVWVQKKYWLSEPVYRPGWLTIPGLAHVPAEPAALSPLAPQGR